MQKLHLLIILLVIVTLAAGSCSRQVVSVSHTPTSPGTFPALTSATTQPIKASSTYSATPTQTPTTIPTPTPTATKNPTRTQTPTHTSTSTLTPTYSILRGQVLELSNCRYGPGAPYLYKYALIEGSNLDVIGRNDLGTWILVQAIGGSNPCWVKASLLEVKGDVMAVAPTYIPLPSSPYYAPLTGVTASRDGDEVVVSWNTVSLRAGDETASPPYLVEAWLCQVGQLIFTPVGSYTETVRLRDEPGCAEASRGRVFLVEKHGYSKSVDVPWP